MKKKKKGSIIVHRNDTFLGISVHLSDDAILFFRYQGVSVMLGKNLSIKMVGYHFVVKLSEKTYHDQ